MWVKVTSKFNRQNADLCPAVQQDGNSWFLIVTLTRGADTFRKGAGIIQTEGISGGGVGRKGVITSAVLAKGQLSASTACKVS